MDDETIDIPIDQGPDFEFIRLIGGVSRHELDLLHQRIATLERSQTDQPVKLENSESKHGLELTINQDHLQLNETEPSCSGPQPQGHSQPGSQRENFTVTRRSESQNIGQPAGTKACAICENTDPKRFWKFGPVLCRNCYNFTHKVISRKRQPICQLDGQCSLNKYLLKEKEFLCGGCRWRAITRHPDFKQDLLVGSNVPISNTNSKSYTDSDSSSDTNSDTDSYASFDLEVRADLETRSLSDEDSNTESDSVPNSRTASRLNLDDYNNKIKLTLDRRNDSPNQSDSRNSNCEICGNDNTSKKYRRLYRFTICLNCLAFINRTLSKNKQYACQGERNCPVRKLDRGRRGPCAFCRWNKIQSHPKFKKENFVTQSGEIQEDPKNYRKDPLTKGCEICARQPMRHYTWLGFLCCGACYMFVYNVLARNNPLICPTGGGCVVKFSEGSAPRALCRACRWNKIVTHPRFNIKACAQKFPISGSVAVTARELSYPREAAQVNQQSHNNPKESIQSRHPSGEKANVNAQPTRSVEVTNSLSVVQEDSEVDSDLTEELHLSPRELPDEVTQPVESIRPTCAERAHQFSRWFYGDLKFLKRTSKRKQSQDEVKLPAKRVAMVQRDDISEHYAYITSDLNSEPLEPFEEITTVELEVRPSVGLLKSSVTATDISQQDDNNSKKRSNHLLSFILHYRRTTVDRRPMIKFIEMRNRQMAKRTSEEVVKASLISPEEDCDAGGNDCDIIEIDCDT